MWSLPGVLILMLWTVGWPSSQPSISNNNNNLHIRLNIPQITPLNLLALVSYLFERNVFSYRKRECICWNILLRVIIIHKASSAVGSLDSWSDCQRFSSPCTMDRGRFTSLIHLHALAIINSWLMSPLKYLHLWRSAWFEGGHCGFSPVSSFSVEVGALSV